MTQFQNSAYQNSVSSKPQGTFAGHFVEKVGLAASRTTAGIGKFGNKIAQLATGMGSAVLARFKKAGDVNRPYDQTKRAALATEINSAFVEATFVQDGAESSKDGTLKSCTVDLGAGDSLEISFSCARDMPGEIENVEFGDGSSYEKLRAKTYGSSSDKKPHEQDQIKDWIRFLRSKNVPDEDISVLSRVCQQGINAILQEKSTVATPNGDAPLVFNGERSWKITKTQDGYAIDYATEGSVSYLQPLDGELVMLDAARSNATRTVKIDLRRTDEGQLKVVDVTGQDTVTAVTEHGRNSGLAVTKAAFATFERRVPISAARPPVRPEWDSRGVRRPGSSSPDGAAFPAGLPSPAPCRSERLGTSQNQTSPTARHRTTILAVEQIRKSASDCAKHDNFPWYRG